MARRSTACSASRATSISTACPATTSSSPPIVADDPLVSLATLADGLAVAGAEPAAPELATSFDFGADAQAVIHLHDGAGWDITGADGTFDYLA